MMFDALTEAQPLFHALFGIKTRSGKPLGPVHVHQTRVTGLGHGRRRVHIRGAASRREVHRVRADTASEAISILATLRLQ